MSKSMDQCLKDLCISTLEYSLSIECKILEDNGIKLHSWLNPSTEDKNLVLASNDFNNKLRTLAILLDKNKLETINYIKDKVRFTYG